MVNTFVCEYSILSEHQTRDNCLTLFGGMTPEDDLRELGSVKLLGRWSCVGEARGYCVVEALDVAMIQSWLINWVPMADIKVYPVLDDNDHRQLILGTDPPFKVEYNMINNDPQPNESLYFIKYKFKEGSINDGFKVFANLTQEQDEQDSGKCTSYGRWHIPSSGSGYAIASSPSVLDIYKWAYNWKDLCEVIISPVTGDNTTRTLIKGGLGFDMKHKVLNHKMRKMMKPSGCFSRFW